VQVLQCPSPSTRGGSVQRGPSPQACQTPVSTVRACMHTRYCINARPAHRCLRSAGLHCAQASEQADIQLCFRKHSIPAGM
jgi:hypothetical protein